MAGASDLYDAAAELLAASAKALAPNAPTRQYVSVGLPPDDCDQLVVYTDPILIAATSPRSAVLDEYQPRTPVMNLLGLVVRVIRCFPVADRAGNPPSVEMLAPVVERAYNDVWYLRNTLRARHRDGSLFQGRDMVIHTLTPVSPSGGAGGWELALTVRLDGYSSSA